MIPNGPHNDWPWPFRYIPRKWTAIASSHPPKKLFGPASGNIDIPQPGSWVLAFPPYFAVTTKNHWHTRLGIRYDYNDQYYELISFTVKRLA